MYNLSFVQSTVVSLLTGITASVQKHAVAVSRLGTELAPTQRRSTEEKLAKVTQRRLESVTLRLALVRTLTPLRVCFNSSCQCCAGYRDNQLCILLHQSSRRTISFSQYRPQNLIDKDFLLVVWKTDIAYKVAKFARVCSSTDIKRSKVE